MTIKQIEAIDETLSVGEEGEILRFIIKVPEIRENTERYKRALLQDRGLPQRAESITSDNPLVAWAIDHARKNGAAFASKDEEAQWAFERAQVMYQEYQDLTNAHAALLASFIHSDNNLELNKEPSPYKIEDFTDPEPLPGLEMYLTPALRYDLNKPLEKRLKRLFDIFDKHPVHFLTVQNKIEKLGAYIYAEVLETNSFRTDNATVSPTGNGVISPTGKKQKVR